MGISKRMKSLTDSVDRDKLYSVDDGIALVKDTAKAKFDESVDASVNLGIDAKKSDQSVRGTDKAGIIHCTIGRASFSADHLQANLSALMDAINKAKPTGTKGIFIKKLSISSTMGVGIKIDQASLTL